MNLEAHRFWIFAAETQFRLRKLDNWRFRQSHGFKELLHPRDAARLLTSNGKVPAVGGEPAAHLAVFEDGSGGFRLRTHALSHLAGRLDALERRLGEGLGDQVHACQNLDYAAVGNDRQLSAISLTGGQASRVDFERDLLLARRDDG